MHHRGPRGEDREKEREKIIEEIIVENSPNLRKEIVNQFKEGQRVPGRKDPRNTEKHIVIKVTKIKDNEKIFKATRDNR